VTLDKSYLNSNTNLHAMTVLKHTYKINTKGCIVGIVVFYWSDP